MNRVAKYLVLLLALFGLVIPAAAILAQGDLIDLGNELFQPGAAQYHVGIFYQSQGDQQRAIAEFTQTVEAMPGNGYAWAARGDSYAAVGNYEEAIEDYSEAIRIYPDYVSALYMRGRAYASLNQTAPARADYLNAIVQMPMYPNSYWDFGDLYFDAGQYSLALENYQMYLALVGDSPDQQVLQRFQMLSTAAATFS